MIVCLHRIEAIVGDQFFFIDFVFCGKKVREGKTYPAMDCPCHGKCDGENFNSVYHCVSKFRPF